MNLPDNLPVRIVIIQVVGFSFIDISVERVTGLENDTDETI
jgi:hypothetical protein